MKVRTCDLILYREHRINILKDKIKETGQTIIDFNDRWTDGFFLFCDENSIPY